MKGNFRTIRSGLGEVICDQAVSVEDPHWPSVTIEPSADAPGEVGKPGPNLPLTELRDGSIVLEFHGPLGAQVLIEDIALVLHKSGYSLAQFLYDLSITLGRQII